MTLGRFSSLRRPSFVQHIAVSCILLWPSASVRRSVVGVTNYDVRIFCFHLQSLSLSLSNVVQVGIESGT